MKAFRRYTTAALIGLIVGLLTLVGQKYLPMNLNFLANSGAVWLIPAFLLSFFGKGDRPRAILTAIICLLGCVYGYYISEAILNRHAFSLSGGTLLWSSVAIPAGAVFGLGAYLANNSRNLLKYCGMNLLPAVFAAEGIENLLHFADYAHMIPAVIMKIVIGVVLYFSINRKESAGAKNILSFVGMTALGVIAYTLLYSLV